MKIMFNSYPLSGHIQLCSTILRSTKNITKDNPEQMAEYDNWVIWKQEPVFFNGFYENVSLCTVIRDPLEVISLNIDRWFGGHSEKRVFNQEVRDESRIRNNSTLNENDINFINHQVRLYKSYIKCFEQRKQPIFITTYNKYLNDTENVVNELVDFCKIDRSILDYSNLSSSRDIENSSTHLYDQIKDTIVKNENFNFISDWYFLNS